MVKMHSKIEMIDIKETWKPIPEAPQYYVSDFGNVKRMEEFPGSYGRNQFVDRVKKQIPGGFKNKYLRVKLRIGPKNVVDRYVHVLVLEAFRGKRPSSIHQASHMNGDTKDNRLTNLKWMRVQENNKMKILHGTSGKGQRNSQAKLTEQDVRKIILSYLQGESCETIAKRYPVMDGTIKNIICRKTWKSVDIGKHYESILSHERKRRIEAARQPSIDMFRRLKK
jgi:hypothetical protein